MVVVFASVSIAYTMRIPNEECTYLVLNTEVENVACGLVSLVTDTAFSTSALLVFGAL